MNEWLIKNYRHAFESAAKKSRKMGQNDFLETLDLCLLLAVKSEEITMARATEMIARFDHYCEILQKFGQRGK